MIQSCENQQSVEKAVDIHAAPADSNHMYVKFSFEINKELYQKTNYGQPPQIAIWIENIDSSDIRTVWVTHRTAKQEWKGKIECPVSLPLWESRTIGARKDFGTDYLDESGIDAVTHATPTEGYIEAKISIPKYSNWRYYIEVNVSADYNKIFSYWSKEGLPDSEANGQPSIIYSGQITALTNSLSIPVLLGRTRQRRTDHQILKDISGITTARNLLKDLKVYSIDY
jgi:hypothetical protein